MARPKEFDPAQALERAMDVFWRKGYDATSVQDLVEGMGINRASLYGTFGDKHSLFVAALDRYADSAGREVIECLSREGPADQVLGQTLRQLVAWQAESGRGCFMTNAAVELCQRCPETASKVQASLDRLREAFQVLVARGQAEGSFAARRSPEALAHYLCGVMQGLIVLGKSRQPQGVLEQAADVALDALRGV